MIFFFFGQIVLWNINSNVAYYVRKYGKKKRIDDKIWERITNMKSPTICITLRHISNIIFFFVSTRRGFNAIIITVRENKYLYIATKKKRLIASKMCRKD